MAQCDCDYILPTEEGWEEHYNNCSLVWSKHSKTPIPKNNDGTLRLTNVNLALLERDFIYHLGIDTSSHDLAAMFSDVKFVCMGGKKNRMKEFAKYASQVLKINDANLTNLTKLSHRYAMYKVGPVICVNHGIGVPSITIVLQEVIKLLHYAKVRNPIIFRIGTSGGLDIPPGSVVITSWALNGTLEKTYNIPVLGKVRMIPSIFDKRVNQELQSLVTDADGFNTYIAGSMVTDDFYRGQARLDGPFCDYTEEDKMSFLKELSVMGVKNIEMEAIALAAITHEAGIRAANICVTFLDRLLGDQVTTNNETLLKWEERPMTIVGRYIAKYYENNSKIRNE